ncbi:hypothetical protein QJS66_07495 [Kocuria rhizophila]|nr:hypothetical protein QJS66_07495 [Kocuria rhizophila]
MGSTQRTATAADQLAETYFHESLASNPSDATFLGFPGTTEYRTSVPPAVPPPLPSSSAPPSRLEEVTPEDDVDRVTLHASAQTSSNWSATATRPSLDVSAVDDRVASAGHRSGAGRHAARDRAGLEAHRRAHRPTSPPPWSSPARDWTRPSP